MKESYQRAIMTRWIQHMDARGITLSQSIDKLNAHLSVAEAQEVKQAAMDMAGPEATQVQVEQAVRAYLGPTHIRMCADCLDISSDPSLPHASVPGMTCRYCRADAPPQSRRVMVYVRDGQAVALSPSAYISPDNLAIEGVPHGVSLADVLTRVNHALIYKHKSAVGIMQWEELN